jgi:hypothetical protein
VNNQDAGTVAEDLLAGGLTSRTVRALQLDPVVDPHVLHIMQVPFRSSVKLPRSPQASPS